MAVETDEFVIATFALWAGDFSYCEKLLTKFSPPHNTPQIGDQAQSPEDFICATGALRLRQLWQKRGEFKQFAAEFYEEGYQIVDNPTVLETKHLRATVWRNGEREFLLQGYLKDLAWQDSLFELARKEAGQTEKPRPPTAPQQPDLFEREAGAAPVKTLGASWIIAGNPFIQVELTDLGMIEATGLWLEPRLPDSAQPITAPFLRLLETLDKLPTGTPS